MFGTVKAAGECSDALLTDFSAPVFQKAFKRYFRELGVSVCDWDGLFREMGSDAGNAAFLRTAADGRTVGFIQFIPIRFSSWFFEGDCGFIREFWVAKGYRHAGHGSALLALAERYFAEHGLYASILTTDTAAGFYLRHGYGRALGCKAKNGDEVFLKHLR